MASNLVYPKVGERREEEGREKGWVRGGGLEELFSLVSCC